ncbi:hypothetical protein [Arsenicitalea aurantiaca]|uniref:hypothetical protein n=1 Tax=Arsenicitalea aurantiaca TaxID=1783274 RepID=UPI0013153AEB|nr:hypothetical protein [Arsenicitalea aurantiaca]
MEDATTFPWLFAVLGGAVILGLVIAFAMARNAKRTPRERALNEQGAREQYHKADSDKI